MRADLRSRFEATLRDAVDHLNAALTLDPQYDDAMAYMNLLLRESADLTDSAAEYQRMTAEADKWIQKALDVRREKAGQSAQPVVGAVGNGTAGTGPAAPPPPPQPNAEQADPPQRITVNGGVQAAMLISRTPPQYPPEAKKAGIQGTVRLRAVLARDGSVKTLELESGHPLLVDAALQAARQWKYRPTLLNGEPIEVVTTVDVNFVLDTPAGSIIGSSPGAQAPEPSTAARATPERIRVGSSVVEAKLISRTPPAYPSDARKAGIEGTVRVKATIAMDGSVRPLEVASGHPMLAPAALEAVRQWKYRPTMLRGEPVEVTTIIDVTFTLDEKPK